MNKLKIVEALNQALDQNMEQNDKIILLGEDIGYLGGVFRVTKDLIQKYGNQRVFETPLTEQGIIGTALGLSVNGFKPVCEIQFDGFIWTGFDHIINNVSRLRTRSRGRFTCPMVIRVPFGGGIHALEHHSESMESVFAHIPGVRVVIPSTPKDAKGLLTAAIKSDDPVIFLEPKRIYRAIKEDVPEDLYEIPLDKAKILREGKDLTIISYGAMMLETKKALKEFVSERAIDFELIDLISLSPIDYETIIDSAKKTGRVVIINEENPFCGLAAEMAARITEDCFMELQTPVVRVTGFDTIIPLLKTEYNYLPSIKKIKEGFKKALN